MSVSPPAVDCVAREAHSSKAGSPTAANRAADTRQARSGATEVRGGIANCDSGILSQPVTICASFNASLVKSS